MSEHSALDEGRALTLADDEVVEDADLDEGECSDELLGELPVRGGDCRDAGGVVMGEGDGRRVVVDGPPDDLAGVHPASVDAAACEFLEGQNAVPVVEEESGEDFDLEVAEPCREERGHLLRRLERVAAADGGCKVTPSQFNGGGDCYVLLQTEARQGREFIAGEVHECAEGPGLEERAVCEPKRFARWEVPKEQAHELAIGERLRAVAEQFVRGRWSGVLGENYPGRGHHFFPRSTLPDCRGGRKEAAGG